MNRETLPGFRKAEWGEIPREKVTVKPFTAKSDTLRFFALLPNPEAVIDEFHAPVF